VSYVPPEQLKVLEESYAALTACGHSECAEQTAIAGFGIADLMVRYGVGGEQLAGLVMELSRLLIGYAYVLDLHAPTLDHVGGSALRLASIALHTGTLPEEHT